MYASTRDGQSAVFQGEQKDQHDERSDVLRLVGIIIFSSHELNLGSAESWRWRIRPGIKEISANCIMHNRSQ